MILDGREWELIQFLCLHWGNTVTGLKKNSGCQFEDVDCCGCKTKRQKATVWDVYLFLVPCLTTTLRPNKQYPFSFTTLKHALFLCTNENRWRWCNCCLFHLISVVAHLINADTKAAAEHWVAGSPQP